MIEDKEHGIKIAEDPEEKLWTTLLSESESLIKQSRNNLIIQEAMKKLAEDKLKKYKK